MTPSNKKVDCGDLIDRISDLPINVIDGILERLPIVDAVKTSLLSRKWRNMWVSISRLEFDNQFFEKCWLLEDHEISSVISKILLLHNGLVYKFTLLIPFNRIISIGWLNNWILFLSWRGIKDIKLVNQQLGLYQVPSHVFACQKLTYFELQNFELSVIPNFCGFKSLLGLHLYHSKFESSALESLIFGCPLLEELTISFCFGFECIDIFAPTLKVLCIYNHWCIKSICLKKANNLIDLTLMTDIPGVNIEKGRVSDLIKGLPKIERLVLGEGYTMIFSECAIPPMLQKSFSSLKYLELHIVNFNDRRELLFIVSLLKNAPNLVELVIKNHSLVIQQVPNYLEELECNSGGFSQLQIVTIRTVAAYKYALDLMRFILANASSLETLTFEVGLGLNQWDQPILHRVSQKLLMMERASKRAKVKFLHQGVTK